MASIQGCLFIILTLSCLFTQNIDAKTVFRRTDKIADNFKQLSLPAEEIDPNVAPPEPQKVETINPEDLITSTAAPVAEVLEVLTNAPEAIAAGANDLIDETINEVDTGSVAGTVAPATVLSTSPTSAPVQNVDDPSAISKYCKCTESHCDCCREFGLPLIPIRGPGCAKITYLGDQKMSVSIKYGDITLASRTISGKKARPICVGLPGGYSQFCGRVYGLSKAKENFKACLGFELRADDEVEAALRVSCFKFGPDGLRVAEAEPLPSEVNKEDDDDDDDIFGFGAGGDDEDDDYDDDDPEEAETDTDDDDDEADDDDYPTEGVEAPADADYGGFSLGGLIDELTDDDDDDEPKPIKTTVIPAVRTPAPVTDVDATRAVNSKITTTASVQSKDDSGTETADVMSAAPTTVQEGAVVDAVTPAATPIETATSASATTITKTKKKSKKVKNKVKRKKAASPDTESDFAFELLNGILDFFN